MEFDFDVGRVLVPFALEGDAGEGTPQARRAYGSSVTSTCCSTDCSHYYVSASLAAEGGPALQAKSLCQLWSWTLNLCFKLVRV